MSQNDYIGKTLKQWPILVDHYTQLPCVGGSTIRSILTPVSCSSEKQIDRATSSGVSAVW